MDWTSVKGQVQVKRGSRAGLVLALSCMCGCAQGHRTPDDALGFGVPAVEQRIIPRVSNPFVELDSDHIRSVAVIVREDTYFVVTNNIEISRVLARARSIAFYDDFISFSSEYLSELKFVGSNNQWLGTIALNTGKGETLLLSKPVEIGVSRKIQGVGKCPGLPALIRDLLEVHSVRRGSRTSGVIH